MIDLPATFLELRVVPLVVFEHNPLHSGDRLIAGKRNVPELVSIEAVIGPRVQRVSLAPAEAITWHGAHTYLPTVQHAARIFQPPPRPWPG